MTSPAVFPQVVSKVGQRFRSSYWVVQARLLTPLTFTRHRLRPLAVFTSGVYFLQSEGGDSDFAKFTVPTLKAFVKARSQNVSGNKQ